MVHNGTGSGCVAHFGKQLEGHPRPVGGAPAISELKTAADALDAGAKAPRRRGPHLD
jgi:hypothetical protein